VNAVELPGDIHTLVHPVLNARAAKAHFRGKQAGLPEMLEAPASAIGVRNSMLGRYVREQGGRLTDEEYVPLVEQTCEYRPNLCSTVFASWAKEIPKSEVRTSMIARLRARNATSGYVNADLLRQLDLLLGGGDEPLPEKTTPAQARRFTALYATHFVYGLPFDRDILLDLWMRCRSGRGMGACYSDRLASERRFGPTRVENP